MIVEFNRDLPIKAEPIDNHYTFERIDRFDVAQIDMGQSSTKISIKGMSGRFNSTHFKFYLHNKEIDIYGSGLLNPYRSLSLPMIKYVN
jgi:hypothetical protein